MENVIKMLRIDYRYTYPFSLQNGKAQLQPFFSKVEIQRYEDSLEVTDVDDLVSYVFSGITFSNVCKLSRLEVREIFAENMVNGVLSIPKDPGMFIAEK